jgi:hypothetical protein
MHQRPAALSSTGRLIVVLAVAIGPACRRDPRPATRVRPPGAQAARRAVEQALAEWRDAPPLDLTTPALRPVMFVDQQRRPGRRLREFAVLGESEMEGSRRFRVRLSLADPDESTPVDYYVFGDDPIWVYRAEDFDMIMHMDKSMMPAADPAAGAPGPGGEPKAEPGRTDRDRDRGPPGDSSGRG